LWRRILLLTALFAAVAVGGFHAWDRYLAPKSALETEYTRVEAQRVALMDAFQSYESLDTVKQRLDAAGMQWSLEQRHLRAERKDPPYDLDTITVASTKHWGVGGNLELEFFNDRLYGVTFRPEQARDYLTQMNRQKLGLERTHPGLSESTSGFLRVSSNIPYAVSEVGRQLSTEPYMRWEDTRLSGQLARWYETYGRKTTLQDVSSGD
jgi:hypothetical protein